METYSSIMFTQAKGGQDIKPTLFMMELFCLGIRYPASRKEVRFSFILSGYRRSALTPLWSPIPAIAMTDLSCQDDQWL